VIFTELCRRKDFLAVHFSQFEIFTPVVQHKPQSELADAFKLVVNKFSCFLGPVLEKQVVILELPGLKMALRFSLLH
jgi:hypothetical protein